MNILLKKKIFFSKKFLKLNYAGIYRVEWKNERKSCNSSIITNADDDDEISHHQISHLQQSLLFLFYKVKD